MINLPFLLVLIRWLITKSPHIVAVGLSSALIEKLDSRSKNLESQSIIEIFGYSLIGVRSFICVKKSLKEPCPLTNTAPKYNYCLNNKHKFKFKIIKINDVKSEVLSTLKDKEVTYSPSTHKTAPSHSQVKNKNYLIRKLKNTFLFAAYFITQNSQQREIIQYDEHCDYLDIQTSGLGNFIQHRDRKNNAIMLKLPFNNFANRIDVEKAILISGKSCFNYFHWIFEYLAKYYILSMQKEFRNIPLIIDADMPFQHYEALCALFKEYKLEKAIIYSRKTALPFYIKELIIPEVPGLFIDKVDSIDLDKIKLARKQLLMMRRAFLKNLKIEKISGKRRLFLSRGSSIRNSSNQRELISFLQKYNFEIVDFSTHSFYEQAKYMREAEYVVGVAGSAFSNIIFCHEQTKIIVLTSEPNSDNCLFSSICKIFNLNFNHLVFKPNEVNQKNTSPFIVDLPRLEATLRTLLAQ